MTIQAGLFDDVLAPEQKAKPQANILACSVCDEDTPYLFKGDRFCVTHHPDPGPYITPAFTGHPVLRTPDPHANCSTGFLHSVSRASPNPHANSSGASNPVTRAPLLTLSREAL